MPTRRKTTRRLPLANWRLELRTPSKRREHTRSRHQLSSAGGVVHSGVGCSYCSAPLVHRTIQEQASRPAFITVRRARDVPTLCKKTPTTLPNFARKIRQLCPPNCHVTTGHVPRVARLYLVFAALLLSLRDVIFRLRLTHVRWPSKTRGEQCRNSLQKTKLRLSRVEILSERTRGYTAYGNIGA